MNFLPSPFNLSIRPALGVTREEILDDGAGEGYRDSIETESYTEMQFVSFRSLPYRFSPRHFPQKHLILRLQSFPPAKKAITESRHLLWKVKCPPGSSETIVSRSPADMSRPTSGWV